MGLRCPAKVGYPNLQTRVGCTALVTERLQGLQTKYALEPDPRKKRDILEQVLALVRVGWEQLFSALSKEENPRQLLLLLAELNRIVEERREHPKETGHASIVMEDFSQEHPEL